MTVIAAFRPNDVPILIGDMAISANDVRTTIRKKIYWISSNLVIGWSGSLFVARRVLKDILDRFNGRVVSKEAFETFLETYEVDASGYLQAVFVGWLVEDKPHCFLWRTDYPSHVFYDHSYSVGSGEKYFRNLLDPASSLGGGGNVVGENGALHETLVRTSQMFFEEMLYQKEWNQTFGFAYDILCWWQGQFRYVNTITHLGWDYFWDDEKKTGRLQQAPIVVKYINCGHFSAIQKVILKDFKKVEQTNYAAKPIYDDMPNINLSHMGFSIFADYYSNYFLYRSNGKCVLKVPYVMGNGEPRQDVWVEGDDQNPVIGVDTKFLDRLYVQHLG